MQHFSYYEIVNSVSEWESRVTGRYYNLEKAKEALTTKADWYSPYGTGEIYRVDLTVEENLDVIMTRERVYCKSNVYIANHN